MAQLKSTNVIGNLAVTGNINGGKILENGIGVSTLPNTIKALSISGRTITYTRGDGTTGTLTTQDTIYTLPTATSSTLGGVKIVDEDLYGKTGGNGYAAGVDHSHSNYAVVEHSSLNGTYGLGTTSLYGHVKLQTGDMNGTTNTNGIAAGLGHTHSNYLTSHQSLAGYATQSWVNTTLSTFEGSVFDPAIDDLNYKFNSYLPKSGGTLTSLLTLTHDKAQLQFRGGHASYDGVISYQTSGNEAMVFSTKNVVTSFMFVNGEDTITNVSSARWRNLTPGLQIKNNKVSIGKLIADGVTPTYNLDVGGTANATTIYENGTALSSKYLQSIPTATTSTLGGVKISNGDVYSVYHTDGLVAGMDHYHSNYLTSHQSLAGYATQTWVNTQISNLVNSAPEALDTLGELATALENHKDAYGALLTTVGNKLDKSGGTITGVSAIDTTSNTSMSTPALNILHTGPATSDDYADLMVLSGFKNGPYGFRFKTHGSGTAIIQSQRINNDGEVFPLSLNPNGGNVLMNGKLIATQEWVGNKGYLTSVPTATSSTLGGVKIVDADLYGKTGGNGYAAGVDHSHSNYAVVEHSSLNGTYGLGTTSLYGHVKLQAGDMNGTTNTNGIAAGLGHTHSNYLPKSGGSLDTSADVIWTKYSRKMIINGNNITFDPTADTGTYAGSLLDVKHTKGTTTAVGVYGNYSGGLTHIFMGGSYSDPAMKMDPSGNFTFKNTITGTITNANQLGGVAASSYATTSSLSNYLPKVGGELSGTLTLPVNKPQIQFRSGHASYDGVISYGTDGNEAMVFSTKNAVTSFMFVNGEDTVTNVSGGRWMALTPGLQIKNNCVSISKLIPNGTTPTYNLDVGGTANATTIYENGTALSDKYQAKGTYITPTTGSEYYSKYIQTRLQNKTSWYGAQYPIYAWWETNSICKWVVDNYETKVDRAVKDADGNNIASTYLPKTTYEYNKEIAFGSTGKLYIGAFPMYDSNITIEISATTSTTYNATLVIATQNINTTGGGSLTATVYGDATNTIAPNIYIGYASGSNQIHVYFSPQSWSKNLIHIQAVALAGAPSNVCTSVDSIPSTANRQPTNALTANFQAKGTIDVTDTTPTSATKYYPIYTSGTGVNQTARANGEFYYYDSGTWSSVNIGTYNKKGILTLHNSSSSSTDRYVDISPTALSANRTLTIPDKSGTIALTNDFKTINGTSLLGNGNINLINGNSALYWSGRTKLSSLANTLINASSEGALVLVRVDNSWDKYGWIIGRYDDGNYDEGRFFQGFISDIYGSIEQVSFVLYYNTVQKNSHTSLDATEIYVIGG